MARAKIELYDDLTNIDFDAWKKSGIKLVCLDVDGTLTDFNGRTISPGLIEHVQKAASKGMRFALLTNNVFGGRMKRFQQEFGGDRVIESVTRQRYFFDRKPLPALFYRASKKSNLRFSEMAMVGDTYAADIQPARLMGFGRVAWVKGYKKSLWGRLFVQPYERRLWRHLSRKG